VDGSTADDDRRSATVVADRKVPPIRRQRRLTRAKQFADVGGVLHRRVEVDIVPDGDWQQQVDLVHAHDEVAGCELLRWCRRGQQVG